MGKSITSLRGQGDLASKIFKQAREITETKGVEAIYNRPSRMIDQGGGAYSSMAKRHNTQNPIPEASVNVPMPPVKSMSTQLPIETQTITKINLNNYFDSLYESLVLVKDTKDYASVVRILCTYYCAGKLGEHVLEGISSEDRQEILGIIRDFANTVEHTLK